MKRAESTSLRADMTRAWIYRRSSNSRRSSVGCTRSARPAGLWLTRRPSLRAVISAERFRSQWSARCRRCAREMSYFSALVAQAGISLIITKSAARPSYDWSQSMFTPPRHRHDDVEPLLPRDQRSRLFVLSSRPPCPQAPSRTNSPAVAPTWPDPWPPRSVIED